MTSKPFRVEQFDKQKHDRANFDCGSETLNQYFRVQVGQDIRRNVTTCYVAVDNETGLIAGYYTLAMGGVSIADFPKKTAKKLPRYPSVPVVRLGRLAIDLRYQGRRLGGGLLADAIKQTICSGVASFAVVVDAKDEKAIAFYEHQGFIKLTSDPNTLFLPISDFLCDEISNALCSE